MATSCAGVQLARGAGDAQDLGMKPVLLLVAMLSGCVQSDEPTAAPASGVSLQAVTEKCGQAPQIPSWSAASAVGDPSHVMIDSKTWDAHVAWTIAVSTWTACVDSLLYAQR